MILRVSFLFVLLILQLSGCTCDAAVNHIETDSAVDDGAVDAALDATRDQDAGPTSTFQFINIDPTNTQGGSGRPELLSFQSRVTLIYLDRAMNNLRMATITNGEASVPVVVPETMGVLHFDVAATADHIHLVFSRSGQALRYARFDGSAWTSSDIMTNQPNFQTMGAETPRIAARTIGDTTRVGVVYQRSSDQVLSYVERTQDTVWDWWLVTPIATQVLGCDVRMNSSGDAVVAFHRPLESADFDPYYAAMERASHDFVGANNALRTPEGAVLTADGFWGDFSITDTQTWMLNVDTQRRQVVRQRLDTGRWREDVLTAALGNDLLQSALAIHENALHIAYVDGARALNYIHFTPAPTPVIAVENVVTARSSQTQPFSEPSVLVESNGHLWIAFSDQDRTRLDAFSGIRIAHR